MSLGFFRVLFTPQLMSVAFREACKDKNGRITLSGALGTEEDWKWLAIRLNAKLKYITSLRIFKCKLSNNIVHFAEALKVNQTLTELNLWNNDIRVEGARHLAGALKKNQTLTKLNLQNNNIKAEGARHLAEALKVNQTLTHLNLSNNDLGVEGARHLVEALKVNQTLAKLNLQNNDLGVKGARHLAEALKVNQTLTELDLEDNDIGVEGVRYLAEVLKVNHTLLFMGMNFPLKLTDGLKRNQEEKKRAASAVLGLILIRCLNQRTLQTLQPFSKLHPLNCLHIIPRELVAEIAQEMWRNKCHWVF